ncbi:MAG TPA: hypothetical protein PLD99_02070 [Parcubacteria group bacterium]|nr:hypothetical protein [Parcubacteria group bacterium]
MPKKIEDVVHSNRKSIRDIPIPIRKTDDVRPVAREINRETARETFINPQKSVGTAMSTPQVIRSEPRLSYVEPVKNNFSGAKRIIGGILVVVLIVLMFITLKNGAVLTYKPRVTQVAFANDTYSAYPNASTSALVYSTIKLSSTKSLDVEAAGDETVSEKSKGRIAIYNEQTTDQQLVKSTRFESTDGKVFRLQEDVTVKAKSNLEVEVIADQPGKEYNITLSDFTLPGLKGTARFAKVYGRSKTNMTGGFIGLRKKVSQDTLNTAKTALESEAKADLDAQIQAQTPEGYILFPGLNKVTYELLPTEAGDQGKAKVTLRGDLSAWIFKKTDLAQYLAVQKLGADKVGAPVDFLDTSKLSASLVNTEATSTQAIKLSFIGSATLISVTDEASLMSDIKGKEESELFEILKGYPSIVEASAVIRPFWKSSFPTDETKIKIEVQK